jgi:TatA/E family protein of Tat protein translocase
MFNIGPMELLVLLVLALIVFGPAKLPEIFGSVGRAVAEFRRASQELTDVFTTEMNTVQSEIASVESAVEELTAEVRSEISTVPETIHSSRTTANTPTYSIPITPALNQGIPINTFPARAPLDEHRPPASFAQMISVPDAARPPPPFWAVPTSTTSSASSIPPVIQEVATTVVDVDQTPIEPVSDYSIPGDTHLDVNPPASAEDASADGVIAENLIANGAFELDGAVTDVSLGGGVDRSDAARADSDEMGQHASSRESLAAPSVDAVSLTTNQSDGEPNRQPEGDGPAATIPGSNGSSKSRGRRPKIVVTAGD